MHAETIDYSVRCRRRTNHCVAGGTRAGGGPVAGPAQAPQRCGTPAGFTLIEVVISLSLVALVTVVVAAALFSGLSAWDAANGFGRQRMDAALVIERMEREIRSAIPFYAIPFTGGSAGVKLCVVEGGAGPEGMPGRIEEVEYVFNAEARTLCRLSRQFPWTGITSPAAETVLRDVDDVRMYYADRETGRNMDYKWTGQWKPHRERLPGAVTLDIVIAEKRGEPAHLSRTIYLPRRAGPGENDTDENS